MVDPKLVELIKRVANEYVKDGYGDNLWELSYEVSNETQIRDYLVDLIRDTLVGEGYFEYSA